jgi:hypothetical protein
MGLEKWHQMQMSIHHLASFFEDNQDVQSEFLNSFCVIHYDHICV